MVKTRWRGVNQKYQSGVEREEWCREKYQIRVIEVDQIESSKVYWSKQRGIRRAECNSEPCEKNFREKSEYDEKWFGEDCRGDTGG